ncbi:unnamed protein product [Urochloa decumbens]|uniref:Uncharacterized protein n=1 Tax=Urochloa decumbens TaxID=240449 RepID=A0ABC8WBU1_9POAL
MAAALRLLARRRATAPAPLPLLQPLIPASTASYSNPPSPLRAAAAIAAAGGRAGVLRSPLCPSPVPSLRLYSSKLPFPLLATTTAATIVPGSHHMKLSLHSGPSLIRHYTSKGGMPPSLGQTINSQTTRSLKLLALAFFLLIVSDWKGIWSFYVGGPRCKIKRGGLNVLVTDLKEQSEIMNEAVGACVKAFDLLEEGLDDKASAMFEQGKEDFFKAADVFEKVLDDIVKRCNELPPDDQKEVRTLCKEIHGLIK